MPKFKNKLDAVHVFKPEGDYGSVLVEAGHTVDVPGELHAELDDAYIVGDPSDPRAFPKSRWQLVTDPKSSPKE